MSLQKPSTNGILSQRLAGEIKFICLILNLNIEYLKTKLNQNQQLSLPEQLKILNESIKITLRRKMELKIYHLDVQSILSKKELLRKILVLTAFFVAQKHGFVSLMIKMFSILTKKYNVV